MKLVDEIIDILSSDKGKLSDALIKTKVLLHQIGHKELVSWVNNELNGYSNKNSTFFYVQKGKEIYAQSWVWIDEKKSIFCFDSVEVLGDKMTDEYKDILTCYIKAAEELSKTYKVVIWSVF